MGTSRHFVQKNTAVQDPVADARRAGSGSVLRRYLCALVHEAEQLEASTQRNMLTHLCGLVGMTLGASRTARQSRRETRRAVLRQQIFTYIETHLRDQCLTAQRGCARPPDVATLTTRLA